MFKKINWLDRILVNPNKLKLKNIATQEENTFEVQEDLANVEVEGTLVSAENLNKIDNALVDIQNGWITIDTTAVYKSWNATTHSGSIELAGDYTAYLKPGTKLKLTQSTDKYFYVKSSTYASNKTTVEFWCPTSATTLVNSTITACYFGVEPAGFNNEVVNADW